MLELRSLVEVTTTDGESHEFCSAVCAETWIEALHPDVEHISVTDEVTGRTLAAEDASDVRSRVPTPTPSSDPVHVFADEQQDREHAAAHRGVVIADVDGDGDEDAYMPSGMGFPYFYWPPE